MSEATPYTSIDHEIFATIQEQIEQDSQVKEVSTAPPPPPGACRPVKQWLTPTTEYPRCAQEPRQAVYVLH